MHNRNTSTFGDHVKKIFFSTMSRRGDSASTCADWWKGKCTRGSNCKFKHERTDICRKFQSGMCQNTSKSCIYLHIKGNICLSNVHHQNLINQRPPVSCSPCQSSKMCELIKEHEKVVDEKLTSVKGFMQQKDNAEKIKMVAEKRCGTALIELNNAQVLFDQMRAKVDNCLHNYQEAQRMLQQSIYDLEVLNANSLQHDLATLGRTKEHLSNLLVAM